MQRRSLISVVTVAVVSAATLVSCNPRDCPKAPPARDFGAAATEVTETTIDIELSSRYMTEHIRATVERRQETEETRAGGELLIGQGAVVHEVRLLQKETDAAVDHFLDVSLAPWAETKFGNRLSLEGYELRLRLVPHLVKKKVVISSDFHRLSQYGVELECPSDDFDALDGYVLGGIYDNLARQEPIVIPTETIGEAAKPLIGKVADVSGVALGTDGQLKLGFLLEDTGSHRFVPRAQLGGTPYLRFGEAHWGMTIDRRLIDSAVGSQAKDQFANSIVNLEPVLRFRYNDEVDVKFNESGLHIEFSGLLWAPDILCKERKFSIDFDLKLWVAQAFDGTSILQNSTDNENLNTTTICWLLVGQLIGLNKALHPVHDASPIGWGCPGIALEFGFGEDPTGSGERNTLYATGLFTDQEFYIVGRSSFMDSLQERPSVPPLCT